MELLGMTIDKYKKKITAQIAVCAVLVCVALLVNVLLCVFRTDETHTAFLAINILVDILALWAVLFIIGVVILPKRKLLRLYERVNSGDIIKGRVVTLSNATTRISGLDCYEVGLTPDEKAMRKIYVAASGGISIAVNDKVKCALVDNIVVRIKKYEVAED